MGEGFLKPAVELHGEEMIQLVCAAGMAGEGLERLAALLGDSREGRFALSLLANSFNALSNALAEEKGWTREQLAACEQDIMRAQAGQLVVEAPKIILNS